MVGGKIHKVFQFEDRLSILVRGTGAEKNDLLVVDCVRDAPELQRGDGIWWQHDTIYWSPQNKPGLDMPIPRIGYSYRPGWLWPRVAQLCKEGICPNCSFALCLHNGLGKLWCSRCGSNYNLSAGASYNYAS